MNVINLTLYDAVGKLIIAQKSTNTINVEQLNKGLYLLKIETDKGSSSKKIIID
ncbi:MAG: T9SS type A sorting domain-containing protein [Gelidibacter sp.]|nr:T9SS type A sorting domain-containing protein [Gelidibacter sp.]